jgi:hypothetical protein
LKAEDIQYMFPVRLEELLQDQTESSSRGMVHRIGKTERTDILSGPLPRQLKNLVPDIEVSEKIYLLNK